MSITTGNALVDKIQNDFDVKVRAYVEVATSRLDEVIWHVPDSGVTCSIRQIISGNPGPQPAHIHPTDDGNEAIPMQPLTGSGTPANLTDMLAKMRTAVHAYRLHHKVRLRNAGAPPSGNPSSGAMPQDRIVKLTVDHGKNTGIGFDNYVATVPELGGAGPTISAPIVDALIDKCQEIWRDECLDIAPAATYNYYFCHENHSSFSSHGSRGRR